MITFPKHSFSTTTVKAHFCKAHYCENLSFVSKINFPHRLPITAMLKKLKFVNSYH